MEFAPTVNALLAAPTTIFPNNKEYFFQLHDSNTNVHLILAQFALVTPVHLGLFTTPDITDLTFLLLITISLSYTQMGTNLEHTDDDQKKEPSSPTTAPHSTSSSDVSGRSTPDHAIVSISSDGDTTSSSCPSLKTRVRPNHMKFEPISFIICPCLQCGIDIFFADAF